MSYFDSENIIGGIGNKLGCQFDNFEVLINSYFSLLFDVITKDGIIYSTGRNGILAKVELDYRKGGFVNYVQPSIGKWDYSDPKYQRKVSPEFVLYLFNNINMIHIYNDVNLRNDYVNEPLKFNNQNQMLDGVFVKDLSMTGIINLHEKHKIEYNKKKNGEPNIYDQIKPSEISMINALYELVGSVVKNSKEFWEFQTKLEKAEMLRDFVDKGIKKFEELSEEEQELFSDFYADEYHYPSLGYLNNSIRSKAAEELLKRCMQVRNFEIKGQNFSNVSPYEDPIGITLSDVDDDLDYYGDSDYNVAIDYSGAKEFPSDINKKIRIVASKSNYR